MQPTAHSPQPTVRPARRGCCPLFAVCCLLSDVETAKKVCEKLGGLSKNSLAPIESLFYIHLGFDSRPPWRAYIVTALDRTWQPVASCSGSHSHLFFPPNVTERKEERERREIRAKSVCNICPVGTECLAYAMTIREPYGIWGGLTETERRQQKARFSA